MDVDNVPLAHMIRRFRLDKAAASRRTAAIPRNVAVTAAGRIEYADEGQGVAVLASHGVCGDGFHAGLWTARHVLGNRGFRVVAPSRFGYLGTPMPGAPTPASQADAFAALLDHVGIEKAIIIGFSAGATAAIHFALRHPGRAVALISVSSNVPGPHLETVGRIPVALRPVFGSDAAWWIFRTLFTTRYLHFIGVPKSWRCSAGDRAALDEIIEGLFPVSDRSEGVIFDTFVSNPSINTLVFPEDFATPALLVHARDDPLAPYGGAVRLAERLPGALFVTLERGGHLQLGNAVNEMRLAVRRFLEAHAVLAPSGDAGVL